VEKNSEILLCGLQDISVLSDQNPYFGLAKSQAAALHKVTLV